MIAALRDSTRSKYSNYLKKFVVYCEKHSINPTEANANIVVNYLTNLVNVGHKYSTICAAKQGISSIVYLPPYTQLSDHPLISQFMKGVHNLRPPTPKLSYVWDVNVIFEHFRTLENNSQLSDKVLTQKLVILLLLFGGQRVHTIMQFHTHKMIINSECIVFLPVGVLKHSKPGRKMDTFQYRSYPEEKLCIVNCLKEYLKRRSDVPHDCTQLLITYGKPKRPAATDTVRRWVKDLFKETKVIPEYFTPHSCRSASTSKASLQINLDDILKQGCWRNAKTFKRYYEKNIIHFANDSSSFQDSIIDAQPEDI